MVMHIKVRAQNHSGCQENVIFVMAHGASLIGGFLGACDYVLLLDWLDPESRWKIGQVGDDGDERAAGINRCPAFANLPIEMRNYRNEQICRFFAPELFQQVHQRPMKDTNRRLKHAEKLRATEGPALL